MTSDPASLDRLHDVISPAPVPWWPPAPGWVWALGALGLAVVWGMALLFLHWQRNRYRREALAEWERQDAILSHADQRTIALAALAELLKRTALTVFPRSQVAALTGRAWRAFLDSTGGTVAFSSAAASVLENAAYDPSEIAGMSEEVARESSTMVRHWIVNHRTGGRNR